jgi:N-acylneuraminate cytidylyltransferase
MKSLAIITARGGSKRIPHKNIREFCGKPIIAYSIEAAKNSGLFDEIMVSTDDIQIARIAEEYGATVPFMRSAKTSDDYATTRDVLLEVLEEYQKRGQNFDILCCIYPTAPFVTDSKLRAALESLLSSGSDMLIPMTRFSFPPQRGYVMRNGKIVPMYPEMMPLRSQDLEPMYHDVGQFYFYKTDAFLNKTKLDVCMLEVSDLESQDIDNLEDWEIAQMKYAVMMNTK